MSYKFLFTFLFACLFQLTTFISDLYAQNEDNRIFYVSNSMGFVNTIQSLDLDQYDTTQLWNSSVHFSNGYHLADEDSVILFRSNIIYKTNRQFDTFRILSSIPPSLSPPHTDFLPDSKTIYYTSNSKITKFDIVSDERTTVFMAQNIIRDITVANSGTVYWSESENLGFDPGNSVIRSYTTEGDTLEHHSVTNGSYGSLNVDSKEENLYFVQYKQESRTLKQLDLENGEITTLYTITSPSNFVNITLDESSNRLLMMFIPDRTSIFEFDLTNHDSPVEIYTNSEKIITFIMDESAGTTMIRTIDGVFDFNFDTNEKVRLAVPDFFNTVLVADPINEFIYFVTEDTPHQLIRTDFSGTEYTSLKKFDVDDATFKQARLDIENNDLYLITEHHLYRMNLENDEAEETILARDPWQSSIMGFDLDLENELIYYFIRSDGIHGSDLDGEKFGYIIGGFYLWDGGLAYDPNQDKIYFSSYDWIYSSNADGTNLEDFHNQFDGFVPYIQYNPAREQIIYLDRDLNGTDRIHYRYTSNGDEPDFGVYHSERSITAIAALQIPVDKVETSSDSIAERPKITRLNQNYPNPFNPSTIISYQVSSNMEVALDVFDITGRHLATLVNERQSAGSYEVTFDGSRLSSGIYFYRLTAGETVQTRKFSLIK